jgi:ABC-2 type transport system permease protein
LLKSIIKNDFRDRGKIFFSIILPLVFMIIFGFVFSGGQNSVYKIGYVGISNQDLIKTINKLHYNLKNYQKISILEDAIKKQEIAFGIIVKNEEIDGIINKNDIKNYSSFKNAFNLIIANYSLKKSGGKDLFKTKSINISSEKQSGNLRYLIPGIIGLSIMSSAMFSAIEIISEYKKNNILKRLAVTPIKPLNFLFSGFLSKLILSFVSAYIIFIIALLMFPVNFNINFVALSLTIISSAILMFIFGAFIAIIFKNPETANNVASMLFTLMMFFSGIYFPMQFLPKYLQIIGNLLPATYVSQFMRYSFGIENLNISYILIFNIAVIVISAILLPLLSVGLFDVKEE